MVAGYHSRTERRLSRRAARRRKRVARLTYVALPTVVLVAAVAVLLALLGGERGQESSLVTGGAADGPKPEIAAGALLVREEGAVRSVLLLSAATPRALVLGVPAITLLRFADGFNTVRSAAAGGTPGGDDAAEGETLRLFSELSRAMADAFQLPGVAVVAVEWAEWRPLLEQAGVLTAPLADLLQTLDPEGADVGQLALAVSSWLTKTGSSELQGAWEPILSEGEVAAFLEALKAAEAKGDTWSSWMLQGRLAGQDQGRYLEPDVALVRRALVGSSDLPAIRVEVQNGSGMLGVAESAASTLAALGFELLPLHNAPGFPDVFVSQVLAAPQVELQAGLIRKVLGVGTLVYDDSLEAGTIIVVLGKDYSPRG